MSTERMINSAAQDSELNVNTNLKKENFNSKVDINVLMDRVRAEKKKEKKENLIFLGVIASVIVITGAIASF